MELCLKHLKSYVVFFFFLFRRLFPNSKIVWIQGKNAGHWIHEDMHEEFMQEVVPFLENDD